MAQDDDISNFLASLPRKKSKLSLHVSDIQRLREGGATYEQIAEFLSTHRGITVNPASIQKRLQRKSKSQITVQTLPTHAPETTHAITNIEPGSERKAPKVAAKSYSFKPHKPEGKS